MMRRAKLGGYLVILLVMSMGLRVARAADQRTMSDIRCIVVAMKMSAGGSSAQKASATMITLYYLGRLDGRTPGLNVEGLIAKEAAEMSAAELRSDAARCGRVLVEKGREIQRIGLRLMELKRWWITGDATMDRRHAG